MKINLDNERVVALEAGNQRLVVRTFLFGAPFSILFVETLLTLELLLFLALQAVGTTLTGAPSPKRSAPQAAAAAVATSAQRFHRLLLLLRREVAEDLELLVRGCLCLRANCGRCDYRNSRRGEPS